MCCVKFCRQGATGRQPKSCRMTSREDRVTFPSASATLTTNCRINCDITSFRPRGVGTHSQRWIFIFIFSHPGVSAGLRPLKGRTISRRHRDSVSAAQPPPPCLCCISRSPCTDGGSSGCSTQQSPRNLPAERQVCTSPNSSGAPAAKRCLALLAFVVAILQCENAV